MKYLLLSLSHICFHKINWIERKDIICYKENAFQKIVKMYRNKFIFKGVKIYKTIDKGLL